MDRDAFEARLKAEGYPEIRTNELPANRHNPEHAHPFDVLALVLKGEITLTVDGKARAYPPARRSRCRRAAATSRTSAPPA